MKNLSLALLALTALSINMASAQAANQQRTETVSNELRSNQNQITNSTNIKCYWLPIGIPICK